MSDIHTRTPVEIAAQIWCEERHSSKEFDADLATSIADAISYEQRHATAWHDTAAQHLRNETYYRGLVVQIGEMFGPAAYVSDDGSVQQDVLCAKVPELVRELLDRS